jgi:uncharacterized glyoxalase superfamily protein PhnB
MSGFVPYFGYDDAAAALAFLSSAFGFETVTEWREDDGSVVHAEMRFGEAVLMLGNGSHGEPSGVGVYTVVEDVDAHCARASAAGAEILFGPEDTEWGTRRYRCRDPEGYEWSFGSYVPGSGAA